MFQKQNQKFKGKKAKYSSNVICDYYRKQCHEEVDCYRLIGFSDDFQFTNDKGFRGILEEMQHCLWRILQANRVALVMQLFPIRTITRSNK